jgi:regulator of RNase E activity RraB
MTLGWNLFIRVERGKPAMISLDMDARPSGKGDDKYLCMLAMQLRQADADGFPSRKELDGSVAGVEDALARIADKELSGRYVGRITSGGMVVFFCYVPNATIAKERINAALPAFNDYRFQLNAKADPEWKDFFKILYPTPEELQGLMNDSVLRNLEEHGDQHSVPREVDFLIRFADEASRKRFRKAVEAAGYEIRDESHSEEPGKLPYKLQLWLDMAVDKETIDETCLDLMDLAEACDAKFDGWETSIVKAE